MNSAVYKLVKDELTQSLQQIEHDLDSFARDMRQHERLQSASEAVDRVRGTLVLMEDPAAANFTQVIGELLDTLLTQPLPERFEQASSSLLLLSRYLEYKELGQRSHPELLLGHINKLRRTLSFKTLAEDFFHHSDLPASLKEQDFSVDAALRPWMNQQLVLFRSGLLSLFRQTARQPPIQRALAQLFEQMSLKLGSCRLLLQLMSLVLRDREAVDGWLSFDRFRLLANSERVLSHLAQGKKIAANDLLSLHRQWGFLLRLAAEPNDQTAAMLSRLGWQPLDYTDLTLIQENQILHGPGESVMQSVAKALVAELDEIKELIDQSEREALPLNRMELDLRLRRIAEALNMVGMTSTRNLVNQLRQQLLTANDLAQESQLARLAEQLLTIEAAIERLSSRVESERATAGKETAAMQLLRNARIALIDQAEQSLAQIKKAIAAFQLSQDPVHVANLSAGMNGLRGAMIFLDADVAADMVSQAVVFVQKRLLVGQISPEQYQAFAELLTSLEFYLEALLSMSPKASEVLNLGRNSLQELAC